MSYENQQQVTVSALDDLEVGTTYVRAPFDEDAIQVNTRALGDLHKLSVAIAPGVVDISRRDGQQFQVNMYYASKVLGEAKTPKNVLASAVGSIALARDPDSGLWLYTPMEAPIEDMYGMNFFLNVLVDKVQEKQLIARRTREATPQNSRAFRRRK
jgi:hypothetical protein